MTGYKLVAYLKGNPVFSMTVSTEVLEAASEANATLAQVFALLESFEKLEIAKEE